MDDNLKNPMPGPQGKLELMATQKISANRELYKVVDFLNKNLKDYRLMFGLTKKDDKMIISIYEVE
ncbi:YpmA family protein [Desulfosporosinus sp. SB140]|uniref:YpmA family protein n=1 Tax=Desulfosporosinus paludis TaxID=3115649 RepID=UPI003890F662